MLLATGPAKVTLATGPVKMLLATGLAKVTPATGLANVTPATGLANVIEGRSIWYCTFLTTDYPMTNWFVAAGTLVIWLDRCLLINET